MLLPHAAYSTKSVTPAVATLRALPLRLILLALCVSLYCYVVYYRWFWQGILYPHRNFNLEPVTIFSRYAHDTSQCKIKCVYQQHDSAEVDAAFDIPNTDSALNGRYGITRTMESLANYPQYATDTAHAAGYAIVMNTQLDSDVPVGYFSWAEYNLMKPLSMEGRPLALQAMALISNCAASSFRLDAVAKMQELGVDVHSYGSCMHNAEMPGQRADVMAQHPFYMAFENTVERDYVTEKLLIALEAGTIPLVIGAPNYRDYEPQPGAFLYMATLDDVPAVVDRMRYLVSNRTAYDEMLAWKHLGPSNQFKSLIDMSVTHSDCRLCINIADRIRRREAAAASASLNQTCSCRPDDSTGRAQTHYSIQVRERGAYYYRSVHTTAGSYEQIANAVLAGFAGHIPAWVSQRPDCPHPPQTNSSLHHLTPLRLHRVYPAHWTQSRALYTPIEQLQQEVLQYISETPCAELEVIFV